MRIRTLAAAAAVALVTATPGVAAPFVPDGLGVGDMYHLLFLSKDDTNAANPTITPYDNFAQQQAALNPELTGTDEGVTYKALVSTFADGTAAGGTTNARDNALVEAPVYLTNGTLIADGFDDLWNTALVDNKTLPAPVNVTQFGVMDTATTIEVITGSLFDGTVSEFPAGFIDGINENVTLGDALASGPQWFDDVSSDIDDPLGAGFLQYRIYALSSKITVSGDPDPNPPTVPLPAGGVLLLTGLAGVAALRRRGKRAA